MHFENPPNNLRPWPFHSSSKAAPPKKKTKQNLDTFPDYICFHGTHTFQINTWKFHFGRKIADYHPVEKWVSVELFIVVVDGAQMSVQLNRSEMNHFLGIFFRVFQKFICVCWNLIQFRLFSMDIWFPFCFSIIHPPLPPLPLRCLYCLSFHIFSLLDIHRNDAVPFFFHFGLSFSSKRRDDCIIWGCNFCIPV